MLLSEVDRITFLKKLRLPGLEGMQKAGIVKSIYEKCRKISACPFCEYKNGAVKKVSALKIIHEKNVNNRTKAQTNSSENFKKIFDQAVQSYADIRLHLHRAQEDLNPLVVQDLFKKIPDQVK